MSVDICKSIIEKRLAKAKARAATNPEYVAIVESLEYDLKRASRSLDETGKVSDGIKLVFSLDALSSVATTLKVVEERSIFDKVVCDIQDVYDLICDCDSFKEEIELRLKEEVELRLEDRLEKASE